ncbi:MAG: NifB/NifX family molybdenum-iron cluster-binding protein [Bacteroidales bacterium]
MKLAVPSKDGQVDSHFGHCDYFTIYTIKKGNIYDTERLDSPQGCGCKSGVAAVLQEKGVTQMLAGNMGDGAYNVLARHQISVIRGCSGPTEELVKAFLQGTLKDSALSCAQHHEHHECQNHEK